MLLLGFKLKKVGFRARKVKTMEVLQQKCTDRSQETPNLSSGWKNVQKRRRLTCSLSFTDLRQASLVQHRAKSGQKSQGFTSDSHTFPKDKIQLHLKLVKDICRYCHSWWWSRWYLVVNLTEGKQAKESSWGDGSRERGDGEVAGMLKQYFRSLP